MSRIMGTREIPAQPARTEEYVAGEQCDVCGERIKPEGVHEIRETTIEMRTGSTYGTDGGDETRTEFDICVRCFLEKLIPWFAGFGSVPRVKETDW